MFVIVLTYDKSLAEIDALMDEHVAFLHRGYEAGSFLASGRLVPRVGGVILAVAASKDELAARMQDDPFVREGAATFEILEFRTSLHHPALSAFADPRTRPVRNVPPPRSK